VTTQIYTPKLDKRHKTDLHRA